MSTANKWESDAGFVPGMRGHALAYDDLMSTDKRGATGSGRRSGFGAIFGLGNKAVADDDDMPMAHPLRCHLRHISDPQAPALK